MGLDATEASSCLRFSLSRHTTAEEVDAAVELVGGLVAALRPLGGGSA
jgi:cysteine sulfinate desulfinase/cysteine desulfurase-like protein